MTSPFPTPTFTAIPLEFTIQIPIWMFSHNYTRTHPNVDSPLIGAIYRQLPELQQAILISPNLIRLNQHTYSLSPAFNYALILQWRLAAREKLSGYNILNIEAVRSNNITSP